MRKVTGILQKRELFTVFKNISCIFYCFSLLTVLGCVGLVEKAGRAADGSAFVEKTIARYRGNAIEVCEIRFKNHDKQIEQGLLITLEEFPFLQFRTTAPDQNGLFFFTSLYYIGGTYSGWNEWTQELAGSGSFRMSGNAAYLNISSPIETGAFISAKILHNDSKRTGEEAFVSIHARSGRITALTEWMYTFSSNRRFSDIKAFEAYWKPVLFPELVNAGRRPSTYVDTDAEWVQAEAVRWNTTYTQELFPEELRPVRDSGALLRDFEEALAWLYCVYEWQNIKAALKENNLIKQ
ncbi:MAG: hypothetical protein LBB61_09905 [Treponema sp.]|jgi:hypothetical protein|nr:hypothetical protein [Treponema sp.]